MSRLDFVYLFFGAVETQAEFNVIKQNKKDFMRDLERDNTKSFEKELGRRSYSEGVKEEGSSKNEKFLFAVSIPTIAYNHSSTNFDFGAITVQTFNNTIFHPKLFSQKEI